MLLRKANGELHFLDFREKAPKAATRDMYLDAQGNVIPNASLIGYKAIGVPGSVAGLLYAEQHWGKLSLRAVMAPAIGLAREGVRLTYQEAHSMRYEENSETHMEEERVFLGDARRIFQRNGKFYEPGKFSASPNWLERWSGLPPILKPMNFTKAQWRRNWQRKSSAAADSLPQKTWLSMR
jgi:Gamma-glutamyltransferase